MKFGRGERQYFHCADAKLKSSAHACGTKQIGNQCTWYQIEGESVHGTKSGRRKRKITHSSGRLLIKRQPLLLRRALAKTAQLSKRQHSRQNDITVVKTTTAVQGSAGQSN